MGFTVYRESGTKDEEFQAYARLLRQSGKDLGKLPRIEDPVTRQRWLHVWSSKAEAEAFAKEIKKRTGERDWKLAEVAAPASEGPLGPLVVQLGRQSTGLTFSLHPLSRALIQSAFPAAFGISSVFIDRARWEDYRATRGGLPDLVHEILPVLSGLSHADLDELGYEVVDDETGKAVFTRAPASLARS